MTDIKPVKADTRTKVLRRSSKALKASANNQKKILKDNDKNISKTFGAMVNVFKASLYNKTLEYTQKLPFEIVNESIIEEKHMTLNPEELPLYLTKGTKEKYISKELIENTILKRGFVKNGVRQRAPQYTLAVPAEIALALIEEGIKLDQQFSSPYLERLNNLHLGFRKYFAARQNMVVQYLTTKPVPLSKDDATKIATQAVTILAYFLTTICGKPAEVSAAIRRATKFQGLQGDDLIESLNNYREVYPENELKCWCYTHSWIKDVAHIWFKCNPIDFIRLLTKDVDVQIKCFTEAFNILIFNNDQASPVITNNDTTKKLQDNMQRFLSNGDINTPFHKLAEKMDYELDDKRFITSVLNKINIAPTTRKAIYQKFQYDKDILVQYTNDAKFLYRQSGFEQMCHVVSQAISALSNTNTYSAGSAGGFSWCRSDTYSYFETQYAEYKKNNSGMVIVELRDELFLEQLAMGSIDDDVQGG